MPVFCLRRTSVAMLLLCIAPCLRAQEISIKRIELENDKVFLFYDLKDSTRGRFYTINLYSSRDNFINPIQKARGDLGLEVVPGNDRRIEVSAGEEFGKDFTGKLAFELRAKIYIPFVRLEGFNDFRKFKRGKPYEVHWTGGRPQNVLNFELYKGDAKKHTFSGIANGGKYTLIFPADTKPGNDYRFRISDSRNKDEVVNTAVFSIRRKLPLLVKTLPVVAVGAALYIVLQPKEECPGCLEDFPLPD